MTFSSTKLLCGAALISLSACGGGGGGGSAGAAGAAAAVDYDPVFASTSNPTIGVSMGNTGVTGLAILSDGFNDRITFESVKIRTTNGGATLILTINGRNFTLTQQSSGSEIYSDGQLILAGLPNGELAVDEFGTSGLSAGSLGLRRGVVGVEAPMSALTGGDTLYRGSLVIGLDATDGIIDVEQIAGTLEITTDFDAGTMSGEYLFGLLTTLGTVSGSTQGNGIIGTLTLESPSGFSGDLQIIAKAFGEEGDTLAGVTGGTEIFDTTTGIEYIGDGTFELEEVPF